MRTAHRIQRQEILSRPAPPTMSFIIWEAALRNRIGGAEVHREQLRHLRACADVPAISLQILPWESPPCGSRRPVHPLRSLSSSTLPTLKQRGSCPVRDPNEVSILTQKCDAAVTGPQLR
ncbi:Scr1 family TA system antitoxin-like transcriptional regulator [Streptomyces sp. NPDC005409]|uniref:Scr1 family TA system antitoxin-like transcriptional regulator n=1 Tax=Streptomyces sp. NPDC005409 TaxID=3155342 RepID=UPI00345393E4